MRKTNTAVIAFGIVVLCSFNIVKGQQDTSSDAADYEVKIQKGEFLVRRKGTSEWRPSAKLSEPIVVGSLDGSHKIYVGTKAIKPPKAIRMEPPGYPIGEQKSTREGQVSLHAIVDEHGAVRDPVVDSSTSPEFSEAAIEAAKKWSFKPAQLNGVPVAVLFNATLQFALY